MPPLPKKKRTRAKKGSRWAHRQASKPNVVECPRCHRPMLTHRACPACGYYRGRDILKVEVEPS